MLNLYCNRYIFTSPIDFLNPTVERYNIRLTSLSFYQPHSNPPPPPPPILNHKDCPSKICRLSCALLITSSRDTPQTERHFPGLQPNPRPRGRFLITVVTQFSLAASAVQFLHARARESPPPSPHWYHRSSVHPAVTSFHLPVQKRAGQINNSDEKT
jgi:hypothetical protein